jgi:hypothetical protein
MDNVSSAHSEQNHASIDHHIVSTGILEPEVLFQKVDDMEKVHLNLPYNMYVSVKFLVQPIFD